MCKRARKAKINLARRHCSVDSDWDYKCESDEKHSVFFITPYFDQNFTNDCLNSGDN